MRDLLGQNCTVFFSVRQSLRNDIGDMLRMRVIRKSESPYAALVVIVKKPDRSNQISVDYRELNQVTVLATPTFDLRQDLSSGQFFKKIDLSKGYWQIPVAEEDIYKMAFTTPDG